MTVATTYSYKVRDRGGNLHEGQLEGSSSSAVAKTLKDRGFVPIEIQEQRASALQRELRIPGLGDRIKHKDVAIFSRQLATMVNSGLTLIRGLAVLAEQTENKALANVVGEVRAKVEQGSSLSAGMEDHPKVFNHLYVAMVRAGEAGGSLDETLLRLADTLEAAVNLRSKVRSAMAYPAVVLGLVVTIVIGMLLFVVPMFENMYQELGGELPAVTRLLISISEILAKFWFVFVGLVAAGVFAARRWIQTENGRRAFDAFKLRMPIFGKLTHKVAISRFSRTLSVLSRSGVPILQALDIVSDTAGNTMLSDALRDVQSSVKQGKSLSDPLQRHEIFPPMVVQMMAVGEETGDLETMLGKVSDFYDREVDDTVNALTSLIEPLLIIVMGFIVGGMLIALYMPMFNIASLIQ
ncbi:MAG: type II secretion system F family protein [Acidimicrobiia bacterium]